MDYAEFLDYIIENLKKKKKMVNYNFCYRGAKFSFKLIRYHCSRNAWSHFTVIVSFFSSGTHITQAISLIGKQQENNFLFYLIFSFVIAITTIQIRNTKTTHTFFV